jgi:hypothetical protein
MLTWGPCEEIFEIVIPFQYFCTLRVDSSIAFCPKVYSKSAVKAPGGTF